MALQPTEATTGRRRSPLRLILWGVLGLVLVVVVAAGAFVALFDPNDHKPRIEAAIRSATGRTIALRGPLRLEPALVPTVSAEQVTIEAPPGFARPELATAGRIEASLALVPLLSGAIEVARVRLDQADIHLQRLADGRANWQAPASAGTPAPAPASTDAPGSARQVHVGDLAVTNSKIHYDDAVAGQQVEVAVRSFTLRSDAPAAPMHIAFDGAAMGQAIELAATTGPLARLLGEGGTEPWPVDATLKAAGAVLGAKGTLAEPMAGRGYALALDGTIPEPAKLAALLPGLVLPPAEGLAFRLKATDTGAAIPKAEALQASATSIDLGTWRPGLALRDVTLAAADADAPLRLQAKLTAGAATFALRGELPPPGRIASLGQGGPPPTFPYRLEAEGEGAKLSIQGQARPTAPRNRIGGAIDLAIADLSRLSPLAGQPLPPLQGVTLRGQLGEVPDGNGVALRNLRFGYADSLLEGEIVARMLARPRIEARLAGAKLDLGLFLADDPGPTAAAPPPAPPAATGRVLPDTPLPIASLPPVDGTLDLRVGSLLADELQARDVRLVARLDGGRLQVDPLQATLPQGAARVELDVDARAAEPPVRLMVMAPAIQAAPLFRAAGLPQLQGALAVDIDLRGRGRSVASILGTSNGHASIAMDRGSVDLSLLGRIGGDVLRAANLTFSSDGRTTVHCLAVRFEHANGVATARTLDLNTDIMTVTGSGSINLARETLDLAITPVARTAGLGIGPGIAVPLRVTGTMAAPRATPDPRGVARQALDTALNFALPPVGVARGLGSLVQTGCGRAQGEPAQTDSGGRSSGPVNQLRRLLPGSR